MADQHIEQQLHDAVAAFQRGEVTYHGEVPAPPALAGEPMVMRGVRLPVDLDRRVHAAAEKTGVAFSTLVREWIELGLSEMEDDQPVSLSALRRAIAHLTQTGRAA